MWLNYFSSILYANSEEIILPNDLAYGKTYRTTIFILKYRGSLVDYKGKRNKRRKLSTSHLVRNLRFIAMIIAWTHVMGTQGGTPVPCSGRLVRALLGCQIYFLSAGFCQILDFYAIVLRIESSFQSGILAYQPFKNLDCLKS